MNKRTFINIGTALRPRMRLRIWSILLWTGGVATVGYWLESPSRPACAANDFYCNLGAGVEASANGLIQLALIFFVWPLGIGIVWGTAELCAAIRRWYREAPERRRYHAQFDARLASALHTRESRLAANELGEVETR